MIYLKQHGLRRRFYHRRQRHDARHANRAAVISRPYSFVCYFPSLKYRPHFAINYRRADGTPHTAKWRTAGGHNMSAAIITPRLRHASAQEKGAYNHFARRHTRRGRHGVALPPAPEIDELLLDDHARWAFFSFAAIAFSPMAPATPPSGGADA